MCFPSCVLLYMITIDVIMAEKVEVSVKRGFGRSVMKYFLQYNDGNYKKYKSRLNNSSSVNQPICLSLLCLYRTFSAMDSFIQCVKNETSKTNTF